MSLMIHCDLKSCDKTRREDMPSMIPDPWLRVESLNGGRVRHFCCEQHCAEGVVTE